MTNCTKAILALCLIVFFISCSEKSQPERNPAERSFASDVAFLKKFTDIIILKSEDSKMEVAISPALQGRVMTSSANGETGFSFGWINKEAFTSRDTSTHMNAFGGEDRFWLGPEGGQYSIYFEKGNDFNLDNWHVPRIIDLDPFDISSTERTSATFEKKSTLTNYSGTTFDFEIKRKIELLQKDDVSRMLEIEMSDSISIVAYRSINTLKNSWTQSWKKETGLLSVWILGMYNPSENVTVMIPFVDQNSSDSSIVNDRYFGKVPPDRLIVKDNIILFKGDGKYRSKIGLRPGAATAWLGSYDADNKILTVVHFNKPSAVSDYVNSFWEIQKDPYGGDAINAYNDGPPSEGAKPLGPFYELETSSPAAALQAGDSLTHIHTTIHFQGDELQLDRIARKIFGVPLGLVKNSFKDVEQLR